MSDCIFCKIAAKEIPSSIVYENNEVISFKDVNPQAPVHLVLIPKTHIETLNDITDFGLYSNIFKVISKLIKDFNIEESGYRIVANCNRDGGQTVFHIHFHLLGGRAFHWPPG